MSASIMLKVNMKEMRRDLNILSILWISLLISTKILVRLSIKKKFVLF